MNSAPVPTTSELTLWIGAFQVLLGAGLLVAQWRKGRQPGDYAMGPLGAMFMSSDWGSC